MTTRVSTSAWERSKRFLGSTLPILPIAKQIETFYDFIMPQPELKLLQWYLPGYIQRFWEDTIIEQSRFWRTLRWRGVRVLYKERKFLSGVTPWNYWIEGFFKSKVDQFRGSGGVRRSWEPALPRERRRWYLHIFEVFRLLNSKIKEFEEDLESTASFSCRKR
jgi:hypothetical protein